MNSYMYELTCNYDGRKSFYGKAKVEVIETETSIIKKLYSYNTMVASVIYDKVSNSKTYTSGGKYSMTTTRHQREFFRQEGLSEEELKEYC